MSPVPMDHHEKMRLRAAAFRVTRLRQQQDQAQQVRTKAAITEALEPTTLRALEKLYTAAHGLDRRIHFTRYLQTFIELRDRVGEGQALEDFEAEADRSRRNAEPEEWAF